MIPPDPGPAEPDGDDCYDFLCLFLELLSAPLYSIALPSVTFYIQRSVHDITFVVGGWCAYVMQARKACCVFVCSKLIWI